MRYSVTGTVLRAGVTAVSFVISQIGAGGMSDVYPNSGVERVRRCEV